MARFILLRVEDNADADTIVKQLQQDGGVSSLASPADSFPEVHTATVAGLFPLPTVFCSCPNDQGERSQGGKRITRGAKLGWWVHRECGRPLQGSWQSPRNLIQPDWSERSPEFMFQPKITWTHVLEPVTEPSS